MVAGSQFVGRLRVRTSVRAASVVGRLPKRGAAVGVGVGGPNKPNELLNDLTLVIYNFPLSLSLARILALSSQLSMAGADSIFAPACHQPGGRSAARRPPPALERLTGGRNPVSPVRLQLKLCRAEQDSLGQEGIGRLEARRGPSN